MMMKEEEKAGKEKAETVTRSELLSCARHCSKCFSRSTNY